MTGCSGEEITGQSRFATAVVFCLFAVLAATFYSEIFDPDFFWHIATGQWIVQNLAIPDHDPFDTLSLITTDRATLILKGYWLSQVLYYLVFTVASYAGIVLLKCLIFLAIFLLVLKDRRGAQFNAALLAIVPLFDLMLYFRADRPNTFSFLFFALLLVLLEKRQVRWLPPVMILWANVHGGYVLGLLLLLIYATVWYGSARVNKTTCREVYWALGAIPAAFLNPGGLLAPLLMINFQGSAYQNQVFEFLSPLQLAFRYSDIYWSYFLALIGGALLLVFRCRAGRIPVAHLLVFLLLAAVSLMHSRYMPFLLLCTAVYIPDWLSVVVKGDWLKGKLVVCLALFAILGLFLSDLNGGRALTDGIAARRFPEGAARYLSSNGLQGRIFCNDVWGGYLIWSTPGNQILVDGRALSEDDYLEASLIQANGEGWQAFFLRKNVDTVVVSAFEPVTGVMQRLWRVLLARPDWQLAYADDVALVFQKSTPVTSINADPALAAQRGWDHALAQAEYFVAKYPGTPWHWENLATIRLNRGERERALEALREALQRDPENAGYRSRVLLLERSIQ